MVIPLLYRKRNGLSGQTTPDSQCKSFFPRFDRLPDSPVQPESANYRAPPPLKFLQTYKINRCSIQIEHRLIFHVYGDSEYRGLGSGIVNIRLPHQLHTPLPNGDYLPIGKQELLFYLLDVIHIHQKTLMTAQESPVSKFFFYGI